jgi:hypothetical protein
VQVGLRQAQKVAHAPELTRQTSLRRSGMMT